MKLFRPIHNILLSAKLEGIMKKYDKDIFPGGLNEKINGANTIVELSSKKLKFDEALEIYTKSKSIQYCNTNRLMRFHFHNYMSQKLEKKLNYKDMVKIYNFVLE